MKLETAFGDWSLESSEVALDRTNRRMWMRRPVMRSDAAYNEPLLLDWETAVARFGRGAQADGPTDIGRADVIRQIVHLTKQSTAYIHANKQTVFAGYSNWRLPTVDDVVSITFSDAWGCKRIRTGFDNAPEITKRLFGEDLCSLTFWTANNLTDKTPLKSLLTYALRFRAPMPNEHVIAWYFKIFGSFVLSDDSGKCNKAILLVRDLS